MNELAINHTLEIKNYEKCIQLLGKVAEDMWQNGMHTAILKYGELLPGELIETNPEFCLYYSWILISAGQIQKAERFLERAGLKTKNTIQDKNLTKDNIQYHKKLLGKIAVAFAYLHSHEKHTEKTFDYCQTAMENLSEEDPLWFSWAWFSYGVAYFSKGDLIKSNEAYNNAFEYGKKSGNLFLISTIVIRLAENEQILGHYKSAYNKCSGLLHLIKEKGYLQLTRAEWTYAALYHIMGVSQLAWADLDQAFENIKIAYDLSKNGKDIFLRTFVLMIYAAIHLEFENTDTDEKINELEELLKQHELPPYLRSMHIGWKIHVCIKRNQLDQANKIVLENGLDLTKEITFDNESAYASYARLLIIEGKLDKAEALISKMYAFVSVDNMVESMIELKNSLAVLYKMRGDTDKAVACLMDAMEMASAENLLFYFMMDSDRIWDIMTEVFKIHATTKTKIPLRFIENLKLALARKNGYRKKNIEIDLSARELDTLRLIARDVTNQEIADKLFISLNTVKTHLKNIYLKLEVDNRSKAATKAKELGIV
jgi:LuxR family maltose regulon positive regulatory protein